MERGLQQEAQCTGAECSSWPESSQPKGLVKQQVLTFPIELKQDSESPNKILRTSRTQSNTITQHRRNQENLNLHGRNLSTDAEMSQLCDKNFKLAIMKMLQQ